MKNICFTFITSLTVVKTFVDSASVHTTRETVQLLKRKRHVTDVIFPDV